MNIIDLTVSEQAKHTYERWYWPARLKDKPLYRRRIRARINWMMRDDEMRVDRYPSAYLL